MSNILILGASGGIGSKLSLLFPDDQLFLHYNRHIEPVGEGFNIRADITKYVEVDDMISEILEKFGRVDVVINATGVSKDGFIHKITPDTWKSVIDINLVGNFNIIRAVLPSMRERNYGRIIMLSSVVSQRAVLGTSAYSASKSGLIGLTRTVALENANKGITCNTIVIGYFEEGILYQIPEDLREQIRESIPQKRFGRIDELYKTIRFLIDTEYMTGQTVSLNGGLYMD